MRVDSEPSKKKESSGKEKGIDVDVGYEKDIRRGIKFCEYIYIYISIVLLIASFSYFHAR